MMLGNSASYFVLRRRHSRKEARREKFSNHYRATFKLIADYFCVHLLILGT